MGSKPPAILGSADPRAFYFGRRKNMKTAILIDGGFYRYRAYKIWGAKSPEERADELHKYCLRHIHYRNENSDLYRIFYYDCPPMDKKLYHPFIKQQIDFKKSEQYVWMTEFLTELKSKRKVAIRLGKLADEQAHYNINPDIVKKLCNKSKTFDELTENDFKLQLSQKGVDMKIGIDIASMAYKKQVDRIILISGDSDFVPASKLARREGIDFILDSMRAKIKPDLHEHIDGMRTFVKNQQSHDISAQK